MTIYYIEGTDFYKDVEGYPDQEYGVVIEEGYFTSKAAAQARADELAKQSTTRVLDDENAAIRRSNETDARRFKEQTVLYENGLAKKPREPRALAELTLSDITEHADVYELTTYDVVGLSRSDNDK